MGKLIYDFDRGTKSLATDERIEQAFGYKPRRFIKTNSAFDLFYKLHKKGVKKSTDELGDVEEEYWIAKPGIDFEILDSITAFSALKKKEIKGINVKLTLPQYGELGESVEDFIYLLTRTSNNVIVLGHTKSEKDDELGVIRYIPALTGRMANEAGRHFDVIAYTHVKTDGKTKTREYLWQILADDRYKAKCRIEPISDYAAKNGGFMPQDFELLFKLANDAGYTDLKILILGDSGTGKTYSLRTLRNVLPVDTTSK